MYLILRNSTLDPQTKTVAWGLTHTVLHRTRAEARRVDAVFGSRRGSGWADRLYVRSGDNRFTKTQEDGELSANIRHRCIPYFLSHVAPPLRNLRVAPVFLNWLHRCRARDWRSTISCSLTDRTNAASFQSKWERSLVVRRPYETEARSATP